jgi:hypothetical protein
MPDSLRFRAPEGLQDSAWGFNPRNQPPPATRPEGAPQDALYSSNFAPQPRRCLFVDVRAETDAGARFALMKGREITIR